MRGRLDAIDSPTIDGLKAQLKLVPAVNIEESPYVRHPTLISVPGVTPTLYVPKGKLESVVREIKHQVVIANFKEAMED